MSDARCSYCQQGNLAEATVCRRCGTRLYGACAPTSETARGVWDGRIPGPANNPAPSWRDQIPKRFQVAVGVGLILLGCYAVYSRFGPRQLPEELKWSEFNSS